MAIERKRVIKYAIVIIYFYYRFYVQRYVLICALEQKNYPAHHIVQKSCSCKKLVVKRSRKINK